MTRVTKPILALGLAGALALAVATPSEARNGRNAAAIGAGIAGLAVGTAIGAAAANNSYYYNRPYGYYGAGPYAYDGGGYAYEPAYTYGYNSYAYSPAPTYYAPGVTRYNPRDPSSYYAYGGNYGPHSYTGWQNRQRQNQAVDW